MNYKIFIFLIFFIFVKNAFSENIALIRDIDKNEKPIFKNNLEQVTESFGNQAITIDYYNMIDWNFLKNQNEITKEKTIYNALNKFFKKNKIKKIIIGGDRYNYNSPKYHPEPKERFYFTKVLTKMIKEKKIKVFGICGGMQGVLYFNGIELDSLKNILGHEDKKYQSAITYKEQFYYDKKQFRNCLLHLNKIYIKKESSLAKSMIKAEKKYKINFERNKNNDLIAYTAFSHFNAVSNKPENLKKIYDKNFQIVGLSEDNIIYIVEDENHNLLIEGHPEISANIIKCKNTFSKENIIFSRILFDNLFKKPKKIF